MLCYFRCCFYTYPSIWIHRQENTYFSYILSLKLSALFSHVVHWHTSVVISLCLRHKHWLLAQCVFLYIRIFDIVNSNENSGAGNSSAVMIHGYKDFVPPVPLRLGRVGLNDKMKRFQATVMKFTLSRWNLRAAGVGGRAQLSSENLLWSSQRRRPMSSRKL